MSMSTPASSFSNLDGWIAGFRLKESFSGSSWYYMGMLGCVCCHRLLADACNGVFLMLGSSGKQRGRSPSMGSDLTLCPLIRRLEITG
jgi:hypothetical protein